MATRLFRFIAPAAGLTLCALTLPAQGSGFRIPEMSPSGVGMANALVANHEEPGALMYNPAAMSYHDGIQLNAGLTYIGLDMKVDPANGTATDSTGEDTFVAPNFYFMQSLSGGWSWGLGLSTPFGLETKWPAGTFQTFNDVAGQLAQINPNFAAIALLAPEESRIEMFNLNPNVAYKIGANTSLSVGLMYYGLQDLVFNTQGIKINGDGSDFGWNLGIMHHVGDWSFGASYRSAVKVDVDGSVDATALGSTRSSATSQIEFPDMLQIGARYRINPNWALEFDYERTGWSSFDVITINHASPGVTNPITSTNNWDDASAYRLGGSYQMTQRTRLYFGYSFDQTPQPDEYFSARVPDADRQLFSLGIGHDFQSWRLEAGYMYVKADERTVSAPAGSYQSRIANSGGADTDPNGTDAYNGTYESTVNLLTIGVSVPF